jgi:hypothetical protein
MMTSIEVGIREVENGFIVSYFEQSDTITVTAELIALDLDEALAIVRDCYSPPDVHDMSNIIDETISKD